MPPVAAVGVQGPQGTLRQFRAVDLHRYRVHRSRRGGGLRPEALAGLRPRRARVGGRVHHRGTRAAVRRAAHLHPYPRQAKRMHAHLRRLLHGPHIGRLPTGRRTAT